MMRAAGAEVRNWVHRALSAMAIVTTIAIVTLPAHAAERTILLYGDSLLAGYGLPAEEGFAAQLQAAMDRAGLDATLVNASVSGDTTADGLARLDWSLAEAPDAVILGLGANDMLQGLPPSAATSNLAAILQKLDDMQVPVLLLGMMADRGLGADYVAAFDGLYPALASAHGAILYPFFLDGVALEPALNQADMRHPNAAGVAHIVEKLLPFVEQLLQRPG
ncbi:arylesterase [Devosia sp.]|uniref:arylesterase n=1 Tax=Devosia sp. TaxID=1871048 RepID=UPI002736C2B8|nr:arylesterase [Devosia sp.]